MITDIIKKIEGELKQAENRWIFLAQNEAGFRGSGLEFHAEITRRYDLVQSLKKRLRKLKKTARGE